MFVLRQKVKGVDDVAPASSSASAQDSLSKKRQLIETFGSKKKQRQMRSQESSQVKPEDAGSVGALQVAIEDSSQMEVVETKADSLLNTVSLPPYNMETDDLSEIYPFNGVIPDDIAESLQERDFLKTVGQNKDKYFKFVVYLSGLLGGQWKELEHDEKSRRGKAITYLYYLMKFARLPAKNLSYDFVSKRLFQAPVALVDYLLNNFARLSPDGVNYFREPDLAVKLKLHICVCSLIANNFSLSKKGIVELTSDLSTVETEVLKQYRQVGCVISRDIKPSSDEDNSTINNTLVSLKAPLQFPRMSMGKKK